MPVLVPNAQNWMHQISFASSMTFSVLVRKQPFVPFVNKFPRNTELYKLMTTMFNEK
jgi:hypothetical protein